MSGSKWYQGDKWAKPKPDRTTIVEARAVHEPMAGTHGIDLVFEEGVRIPLLDGKTGKPADIGPEMLAIGKANADPLDAYMRPNHRGRAAVQEFVNRIAVACSCAPPRQRNQP